jgi:hypothetical protein
MAAAILRTISELARRRSVEQVRPGSGAIGRGLLLDNIVAANVHRALRWCRRGAQFRLGLGPSQPDLVGLKSNRRRRNGSPGVAS